MQDIAIAEVGLDEQNRTFVRPVRGDFEHVYRAAMEVYWDREHLRLSHPAPRNMTPAWWYNQIIAAVAGEYGTRLRLTDNTEWTKISPDLRTEIVSNAP